MMKTFLIMTLLSLALTSYAQEDLCEMKLKDLNHAFVLEFAKKGRFNRHKIKFQESLEVVVTEMGNLDVKDSRFNRGCIIDPSLSADFSWGTFTDLIKYTSINPDDDYKIAFMSYNEYLDEVSITAYRSGREKIRLECKGLSLESTVQELEDAYGNIFVISE